MLQEICEHLLNYFAKTEDAVHGEFVIADGAISPTVSLLEGQRFHINGSALNDGVYTYHLTGIMNDDDTDTADLSDETFEGTVWPMAVPKTVLALSSEIADWQNEYGGAVASPYTSENVIGVYSYTLKSGGSGSGGNGDQSINWQSQFRTRLNRWRKICL